MNIGPCLRLSQERTVRKPELAQKFIQTSIGDLWLEMFPAQIIVISTMLEGNVWGDRMTPTGTWKMYTDTSGLDRRLTLWYIKGLASTVCFCMKTD